MVRLLLQSGANPAALNEGGQVPIDNALDDAAIGQVFQQHSTAADSIEGDITQPADSISAAASGGKLDAQDLAAEVQDMSITQP